MSAPKKSVAKPKPATKTPAKPKKEAAKLTPRQQMFCREYVIDLNATQAAIRAGYSAKTADVAGPRLLGNVRVAELIQTLMDKRSERVGITADAVLAEIAKMAFANMQDYTSVEGDSIRPNMSRVTRDQMAAIQEFTVDVRREKGSDGSVGDEIEKLRFKLADKKASLELLGRHLKLFTDKVELTGKDGAAMQVISADMPADVAATLYKELLASR